MLRSVRTFGSPATEPTFATCREGTNGDPDFRVLPLDAVSRVNIGKVIADKSYSLLESGRGSPGRDADVYRGVFIRPPK